MASHRSSTSSVASGMFMILFGGFFAIVGLSLLVTQLLAGSDIMSALFSLAFPAFGFFIVFMGVREIKKAKASSTIDDRGVSSDSDVRPSSDRSSDGNAIELFLGIMFTFIGTLATITVLSSGGGFVALFTLIFVIVGVVLLVSSVKKIKKSKNSNPGCANDSNCHSFEGNIRSSTRSYENNVFKDNPNANGRYEPEQRASDMDVPAFGSRVSRKNESNNGVYTYFNCPSCGSLNESGSKACRNCGKRF